MRGRSCAADRPQPRLWIATEASRAKGDRLQTPLGVQNLGYVEVGHGS